MLWDDFLNVIAAVALAGGIIWILGIIICCIVKLFQHLDLCTGVTCTSCRRCSEDSKVGTGSSINSSLPYNELVIDVDQPVPTDDIVARTALKACDEDEFVECRLTLYEQPEETSTPGRDDCDCDRVAPKGRLRLSS